MHPDRLQRSQTSGGEGGFDVQRPRVVILDQGDSARVEIIELPESVTIGGSFCHLGICWRVTGQRPGSRVFIAVPEGN
jgi:hypothetical protein